MTNQTGNLAQDAFAWLIGFFTAIAGFVPLEKWALIIGIACTVFTTVSSQYYRRETLKVAKETAEVKKANKGH